MFFKKRRQKRTDIDDLVKEIHELKQVIQGMQGKHVEYHIHFDQVDIHDPNLEQLTFQLDHLDIDELSGALNMGNNFGVNVKPKNSSRPELSRTDNGLKFSFKSKEDS
ncbi:hypothetical protein LC065_07255 [Halobacillus litoralis]|uniref:hypothetical protein n=1 Tax=Halobacillus litoralis TaxID=45668 RepID=UPI001CFCB668|nr:hypothetical protein [Halobacillus litoralis]WLR48954.1 hypothetical protein LC065_07255 [Halobacillus litoralis]